MEKITAEPMQNSSSDYGRNGPNTFGALVLAVVCIIFWGITFVNTKALSSDFSALEILVFRFLLAYVCLWIFFPKMPRLVSGRHEIFFAAAGFFGVTFYQYIENLAISYTAASNVSIIVSTCPMLTGIAAGIFLKEKIALRNFLCGFVLSFIGVILVSLNGRQELNFSPKGDLLALLAAVSWAFYSLFVSRINSLGYPGIFTARRTFFWALLFMIPLVLLGKITGFSGVRFEINPALFKKPLNILNLSFLGAGASAFCFFAWNKAAGILGMVRTTFGLYFIPVVTITVSAVFLGERLCASGIFGAVLVLSGLVISSRK